MPVPPPGVQRVNAAELSQRSLSDPGSTSKSGSGSVNHFWFFSLGPKHFTEVTTVIVVTKLLKPNSLGHRG